MLQIEVKQSFRVQSFAASSKSFTLKGGARHRFINRELQSALSPRVLRAYSNALNTRSNDFIRTVLKSKRGKLSILETFCWGEVQIAEVNIECFLYVNFRYRTNFTGKRDQRLTVKNGVLHCTAGEIHHTCI